MSSETSDSGVDLDPIERQVLTVAIQAQRVIQQFLNYSSLATSTLPMPSVSMVIDSDSRSADDFQIPVEQNITAGELRKHGLVFDCLNIDKTKEYDCVFPIYGCQTDPSIKTFSCP